MENDRWTPDETYIILILGSNPKVTSKRGRLLRDLTVDDLGKNIFDPNTITHKYINYHMAPYSVLVKRLANFYNIPNKNVKILAKGTKEDFSVNTLTNGKLYLQLDALNVYETQIISDELDFIYFSENDTNDKNKDSKKVYFKDAMQLALDDIPYESRILCFLYDNGLSYSLARIPLLKVYIPLIDKNPKSLRLFNDSFYSGSMIDLTEKYYKLTRAVVKATGKCNIIIDVQMVLLKIANKIGLYKYMKNDGRTENECYQLTNLYEIIHGIQKIIDLQVDNLDKVRSKPNFTIIVHYCELAKKEGFNKLFGDKSPITDLPVFQKDTSVVEMFEKFGFKTLNDIFFFITIIEPISNLFSAEDLFTLYNKQNIEQLITISNELNCVNTKELYDELSMFKNQGVFDYYLFPTSNDRSIITSAFPKGKSVTFGTRRIEGTQSKFIFGSPAFGAFVDEVFFNVTDKPIDVENIREEAVGIREKDHSNESKGALEYAAVCPKSRGEKITTEWIRLDIKQKTYGCLSNERFFSDELIKKHSTKEEILDKIGFKLVQKFEEDGETPVDEKNTFFVEKLKDETPRHRIRRSNKPIDNDNNEIKGEIEYDEYYSEDEIYCIEENSLKSSESSTATPSASESEDYFQYVTLKRKEAEKIFKKLGIPTVSWGVDVYRFIVTALIKKSKELESYIPFNPDKEVNDLYSGFYDWAAASMSKYIDVSQICDAHRLILRISDWANDNFIVINYEFQLLEHLIASVCRLAKEYITEAYRPYSIGEVTKRLKSGSY